MAKMAIWAFATGIIGVLLSYSFFRAFGRHAGPDDYVFVVLIAFIPSACIGAMFGTVSVMREEFHKQRRWLENKLAAEPAEPVAKA